MEIQKKIMIVLCIICKVSYAQWTLPNPDLVRDIENRVSRNIFVYRITNTPIVKQNVDANGFLKEYASFETLIPNYGTKLDFKISEVNMQYPDTRYKLYSLYKHGEIYVIQSLDTLKIHIDSTLGIIVEYPYGGNPPEIYNNTRMGVFCFKGNPYGFQRIGDLFSIYFREDRMFLIGIDTTTTRIYNGFNYIYISGNFYLNAIAKDFNLDINNPESFYEYLKFKTFNYQTENIRFLGKRRKYLMFEADYGSNGFYLHTRKSIIFVNSKDLEKVYLRDVEYLTQKDKKKWLYK